MTDEAKGWFHCGRCGHLFQEARGGMCPDCGRNPVVSDSEMAYAMALAGDAAVAAPSEEGPSVPRKREKSGGLLRFTIAWIGVLALLAGILVVARLAQSTDVEATDIDLGESSESYREVNEAYSQCYPILRGYYSSVSPEVRAPFTLRPNRTVEQMSQWSEEMVIIRKDDLVRNRRFTVFETSEGPSAASIWELENGDRIDAVFRKNDENEWRIDWEQMVRYSTETWPVFLSGLGGDAGEFRLLARRRASASLGVGDVSRIIFHEPSARSSVEFGAASPEVPVDPQSEMGIKLSEAFEMRDAGLSPFGAGLTEDDPMGMIRVRVKLHLGPKNEHGRLTLVLDDVVACHWMGIDDSGKESIPAPEEGDATEVGE